ncbi:hypothetical protein CYMTET_45234 [Cymbomonas tetramitiformis]|uniref:Uncharacterized protein n=1 Tax=Cymbomonas tetramitiformis TaxID=36881 RepID=A0AAE0EYI2_9CHLO|nr:hypothetical protein CYMTET_45234 [Cymbomonas tetramitiformis]
MDNQATCQSPEPAGLRSNPVEPNNESWRPILVGRHLQLWRAPRQSSGVLRFGSDTSEDQSVTAEGESWRSSVPDHWHERRAPTGVPLTRQALASVSPSADMFLPRTPSAAEALPVQNTSIEASISPSVAAFLFRDQHQSTPRESLQLAATPSVSDHAGQTVQHLITEEPSSPTARSPKMPQTQFEDFPDLPKTGSMWPTSPKQSHAELMPCSFSENLSTQLAELASWPVTSSTFNFTPSPPRTLLKSRLGLGPEAASQEEVEAAADPGDSHLAEAAALRDFPSRAQLVTAEAERLLVCSHLPVLACRVLKCRVQAEDVRCWQFVVNGDGHGMDLRTLRSELLAGAPRLLQGEPASDDIPAASLLCLAALQLPLKHMSDSGRDR